MTNRELAERLQGSFAGEECEVVALSPIDAPQAGGVSVALSSKAISDSATLAPLAALVVSADTGEDYPCPLIRVPDPRLALARLTALFDERPRPAAGVHPSAVVAEDARIAPGASLGAGVVIGAGVSVAEGSAIESGCVIGAGSRIGANCRLHANVTLYDGVILGDRVTLHSGVTVGQDGFGFAAGPGGAEKIHHLGWVEIEDDVEIGAGSAVDRGTLTATRIGARSKIGNLCLVAHNVEIGSDCLLTGMIAIGGSVRIGEGVMIGGGAVVRDHIRIGDGARLAAGSGLGKHIPAGETWGGAPARPFRQWVRGVVLQERLEQIWRFVRERS